MPNPSKYKDKAKYMKDCMHTTKAEGKDHKQSVAMCLSLWRDKHRGKDSADYSKYVNSTPVDGGEYYVLMIPKEATPPELGDKLVLKGNTVVVYAISTPEDIYKGRGAPVARSMEENGIGWSIKCLPEGHEYLKNPYWSQNKQLIFKAAGKLQSVIDEAKKQDDLPSVFLGGSCDDDNAWRKEVQKEFKDKFFFIDPYDPDWEAEGIIYEELAAILNVDHIIFYRGGEGTEKEKEFAENADKDYKSFDSLDELKSYLKDIIPPAMKKACISEHIRRIAGKMLLAKLNGSYDFSSLQIQLPEDLSKSIIDWGKKNIPDEFLHNNEKETKGREDDIHVTLLYGIESPDPDDPKSALELEKGFSVRLGLVTIFRDDPEYDVIKIDVESPELIKLHYMLERRLINKNSHPTYFPHITLAYVKKDSCASIIGSDFFIDKKFIVSDVVFSSKNEKRITLNLKK